MWYILIIILIIVIIWFVYVLNRFIYLKKRIERSKSVIDVFLKERFDLIPNLVESCKGYLNYEKETLSKIVELRTDFAKNNNQKSASELNTKWYKNADDMAEAFSSINPFYPKEEVRRMLYEHLRLTTDEVNNRIKGNYAEDIRAYDMVQKEILRMSQFFVDGIVRQFNNLF